jgi:hypothetical protein
MRSSAKQTALAQQYLLATCRHAGSGARDVARIQAQQHCDSDAGSRRDWHSNPRLANILGTREVRRGGGDDEAARWGQTDVRGLTATRECAQYCADKEVRSYGGLG